MSFLSKFGHDAKAVFGWLGSPRGQAVIGTAGVVAEAFGAPVVLVNMAETWIQRVVTTEALAQAAGEQAGSGTQKAAAVINQMTPVVASYFPGATQEQMKKANDAIVAFLNAFDLPTTPTTPANVSVPAKAS
jgi:hypothetical protein